MIFTILIKKFLKNKKPKLERNDAAPGARPFETIFNLLHVNLQLMRAETSPDE